MSLTKQELPDEREPLPEGFEDGLYEYDLEKSLDDFRARFGDEKLAFEIDLWMTRRGIY